MPPITVTLKDLKAHVGGELLGDPETDITGVNAIELAGPGELAFAASTKYLAQVPRSRAAAFLIPKEASLPDGRSGLRVEAPKLAFIKVMALFQRDRAMAGGVDRHAVVAPDAELGEDVVIREFAVIRSKARIGRGTVVESGAHLGERVTIGEGCWIGPNVVIMRDCRIGNRVIIHGGAVIGADGFGFVWDGDHYAKVPQIGTVILEDDVELGANVCVDRATLGATVIKRGTKVDNLVQIAHNDLIGEHVIMSGQVGLAGSVRIGDRVVLGGQVGVADHVTIGHDAKVGGGSGVIGDIPPGQMVWWFPARPMAEVKRELAAMARLPQLLKTLTRRPARTRRSKR